jgi:hypothetical protein
VGLKDDYSHEGRALVEEFKGWAQPASVKHGGNFVPLAQALKQITSPVGPLGLASLHASTVAMEGGNSTDDSAYAGIENQLSSFTAERDALVAQMLPLLEAAEHDGTPIPDGTANTLIHQAADLLSRVQAYSSGLH